MGGLGLNFSISNIIVGLIFSGIGFVAFNYGRREGKFQTMALGGALMVFSYFTPSTLITVLVGSALTAYLYYSRD